MTGASALADDSIDSRRGYRPLAVPVAGIARSELRDTWGEARATGRRHQGIDIMAPHGTPVLAVTDGRVAKLFRSETGGITLYQFSANRIFVYYYAHLERYADGIEAGAELRRGQVIGHVGDSGNARDPHLHFEIGLLENEPRWWVSKALNPWPLLAPPVWPLPE